MKKVMGSLVCVLVATGIATAAVNVDVNTPNASVRIGTPQPAPQVTVIEREQVVEKDRGKHKGHKKHKKHKKERHDEREKHDR